MKLRDLRLWWMATLFLALSCAAFARDLPEDITIRAFAKPDGARFHLLVRVPLRALNGVDFPSRGGSGELDLERAASLLPSAARWWIADSIDLYEGDTLLQKPQVVETRISLPSDNGFASYEQAWAHFAGAGLPDDTQIVFNQAMFDVLFDYPIHSDRSSFAIRPGLARLGIRVSTGLSFLPPGGTVQNFEYQGDPGLFRFNPSLGQTVTRFIPMGFFEVLRGTDTLLFLFCAALLLPAFSAIVPFAVAFTIAHSIALLASAGNIAPDALWFPVLIETLMAASIVYMAFENIAGGVVRRRWILAAGCGIIFGFGFSFALRPALQFAGAHVPISALSYNAGIELGQILVLALLVPAIDLLFRLTSARRRVETIVLAALAADTGWNRASERAERLSQFGFKWPTPPGTITQWLTIILIAGGLALIVTGLLRHRAGRGTSQPEPRAAARVE
jgi:hypothetical protein